MTCKKIGSTPIKTVEGADRHNLPKPECALRSGYDICAEVWNQIADAMKTDPHSVSPEDAERFKKAEKFCMWFDSL